MFHNELLGTPTSCIAALPRQNLIGGPAVKAGRREYGGDAACLRLARLGHIRALGARIDRIRLDEGRKNVRRIIRCELEGCLAPKSD
jgi:hypothetical protein